MISKHLAAIAVTTALVIGGASVASAQNGMSSGSAGASNAARLQQEGDWRASKLVGVNVYNDNNEKIGDINDIILDKSGKVVDVVLGVGGFLGMGEHYVAVSYDKLKWSNEPVRSTTSSSSSTTTASTTGSASSSTANSGDKWYPDHAVFNATKDQLKAMPQFQY